MRLAILSAAGNAFAVLDAVRTAPPERPDELARALCAERGSALLAAALRGGLRPVPGASTRALDGLLLALPPERGGDCRMRIHNADGSRPEACGNGLRCLALFARQHGLAARDEVLVETDAGTRTIELTPTGATRAHACASMGQPLLVAESEQLDTGESSVQATLLELGNPHCVLFVEDLRRAPVESLGPLIERHPRFPARTNVEFVAPRGGRLAVRVWERGVGETASCGTGACAAALAAAWLGRADLPLEVELRGGVLGVSRDASGEVWLAGPCEQHAEGEWTVSFPAPHRLR